MVSKKTSRLVARFKRELVDSNASGLIEALSTHPSEELLVCFREQKLLYCVSDVHLREQIVAAVNVAVRICLADRDQTIYCNYITFALLTIQTYKGLTARAQELLRAFPRLSLREMLTMAGQALGEGAAALTDSELPRVSEGLELPDSVAALERTLHNRNGLINDLTFAVARAVNELSRTTTTKNMHGAGAAIRATASATFKDLVWLASEWNGLEFLVDSVAFGDFQVTAIQQSPKPVVALDYIDSRRTLLRLASIRRRMITLMFKDRRAKRWIREFLSTRVEHALAAAVKTFERQTRGVSISHVEMLRCQTRARELLMCLDAEDDLLCAAAKSPDVVLYYVLAVSLHWFSDAAALVRKHLPQRFARTLESAGISLREIENVLGTSADNRATIRKVLAELSISLPVRRHFDLIKLPFIRDGSEKIHVFSGDTNWNVAIRERLIHGGALGKDLGRVWEGFMKDTFTTRDWRCIGQGVRARASGRIATDIDLLLLRDGLLLIAQVKAMIGSGTGPYDHWKNRQTIEFGCHQARLAADILAGDPERLVSFSDRKTAAQIRHIEPVVLTNIDALDGWICNGVTVLGTASINAITQGMRVKYMRPSGQVVETKQLVEKEQLSRDTVLWMLRNPIETLVASEDGRTEYIVHEIEGIEWRAPVLAAGSSSLDLSGPFGQSAASSGA